VGVDAEGSASLGAETADAGLSTSGPEVDDSDLEIEDDDDPGMVRGRREPMALTQQGPVGLFYTSLPDVGGKYTFRFRVHTDFFRKQAFIYDSADTGADEHARVRGGISLGFTPFKWGELFWGVRSQANRNTRDQEGRQDPETVFALGDMDFGVKAAHRFKDGGIGLGAQLGVGLLSGTERLLTSNVNFWFDALFAVDLRYLTKKKAPVRFATNIGWILDNSLNVVEDWSAITDATSREVNRFSLGVNHSRVRLRIAADFPIRLGKERQVGLDPILEWAWDIATTKDTIFEQADATASPLPRSSQWLTLGFRVNPVGGLLMGIGADIGLVSPNFENGPPVPPWQLILGIGWSVDPNPIIKEVEVAPEVAEAPPAVLDGRILGQIVGSDGTPVPNAKVSFPGLTTNAILTDESGSFTSYRFPAGVVQIQVELGDKIVYEGTADVTAGEDTNVSIQLEVPAVTTGIVQGTFTNEMGESVKVTMKVTGQGVDEAFESTDGGLIALELYAGDYSAVLSAPGYKDKSITFTVEGEAEVTVKESLASEKPPETPNIRPTRTRIRVRKKIRYTGTEVRDTSYAILEELAVFLKYHPEYELITIQVHTDDSGSPMARSNARAEAVRTFLVNKGVESERLDVKGYGSTRPIAVNMTAKGRAQNNRTYFRITRKK
jgi:outer membrane protein OmpA-like peptidoglycan-associated protein